MDYSLERFEAEINIEDYIKHYVDVDRFLECCEVCTRKQGRPLMKQKPLILETFRSKHSK